MVKQEGECGWWKWSSILHQFVYRFLNECEYFLTMCKRYAILIFKMELQSISFFFLKKMLMVEVKFYFRPVCVWVFLMSSNISLLCAQTICNCGLKWSSWASIFTPPPPTPKKNPLNRKLLRWYHVSLVIYPKVGNCLYSIALNLQNRMVLLFLAFIVILHIRRLCCQFSLFAVFPCILLLL